MNVIDNAKAEYLKQVRMLLCNHQPELRVFEESWSAKKFREAYLLVDEIVRNFGLVRSNECKKADEDFYWLFIN